MSLKQSSITVFEAEKAIVAAVAHALQGSAFRFAPTDRLQLGLDTPACRRIARRSLGYDLSRDDRLRLARGLLAHGLYEFSIVGTQLIEGCQADLKLRHFRIIEDITTSLICDWAVCDDFALRVTGPFLLRYPVVADKIRHWLASENKWVKRSALVALIKTVRLNGRPALAVSDVRKVCSMDEPIVRSAYIWFERESVKYRQQT